MASSVFAPSTSHNDLLLPVTEHWLKARIDAPIAALERLDQNAKQMIAVAGGLQVVLTAIIKLAPEENPTMLRWGIASFSFLFLSVACAALVLFHQPRVMAANTVSPVLGKSDPAEILAALTCQVTQLCADVDQLLTWKRSFLLAALSSFSVSMLTGIGCLHALLDVAQRAT